MVPSGYSTEGINRINSRGGPLESFPAKLNSPSLIVLSFRHSMTFQKPFCERIVRDLFQVPTGGKLPDTFIISPFAVIIPKPVVFASGSTTEFILEMVEEKIEIILVYEGPSHEVLVALKIFQAS